MEALIGIIVLISWIYLILGLIRPKLVSFGKKEQSRGKIALISIAVMVAAGVLMSIVSPEKEEQKVADIEEKITPSSSYFQAQPYKIIESQSSGSPYGYQRWTAHIIADNNLDEKQRFSTAAYAANQIVKDNPDIQYISVFLHPSGLVNSRDAYTLASAIYDVNGKGVSGKERKSAGITGEALIGSVDNYIIADNVWETYKGQFKDKFGIVDEEKLEDYLIKNKIISKESLHKGLSEPMLLSVKEFAISPEEVKKLGAPASSTFHNPEPKTK